MENRLVVKPKTCLVKDKANKDILSYYKVPAMIDALIKKDKTNLLNILECGAVVVDSLNKMTHYQGFSVDIPKGLLEMIRNGEAHFDKSNVMRGNFTPNIRIDGQAGIQGQATIHQGVDTQALTSSVANLAMMAMVQSVLAKMEVLDEKLNTIIEGQKNDRIGRIIGAFKSFTDLYPSFQSDKEMRQAAYNAYQSMQEGLAQLHLQIEESKKKMKGFPKSNWSAIWKGITHPTKNISEQYQNTYREYMYDIQLYNRLILLSDIVLQYRGVDFQVIENNHRVILDYCKENVTLQFKKEVNYLMQSKTDDIDNIISQNEQIELALSTIYQSPLSIEYKRVELKM